MAQESDLDDWDSPLDPIVITTQAIADRASPVLLVIHDEGHGGWQFYDGSDVAGQKPVVLTKDVALALDSSIAEITDLPVGWQARWNPVTGQWLRSRR